MPANVEFEIDTVRVEVADPPGTRDWLAGLGTDVMLGDEDAVVKFTVAVNPVLFSVMLVLPLEPAVMVKLDGLSAMVKLPVTVIINVAWRIMIPLVALTVTM